MSQKLNINDIRILNEGQQVKRIIETTYGTLKEFHQSEQVLLSIKTLMNYCCSNKITSDTFKCVITDKLDMSWADIVISEANQVKKYVNEIFCDIILYDKESDLELFDILIDLCNQYDLKNEAAIMHRNIAKNFYFRNDSRKAIYLYHAAIDMLPEKFYNSSIILHVELADHLYMERNTIDAEKHYSIAAGYTKHIGVSSQAMYTYYYRRGIMFNSSGQYHKAREFFNDALEYAHTNTEAVSETGATLMAIGSTFARENRYNEAKDYYFKSLLNFHENDINGRGLAVNNISEIYCKLGDYNKAIHYIEHALDIFGRAGITNKLLICAETYAEIKLETGDDSACYNYLNILKKTVDTSINKKNIKNSICNMINIFTSSALLNELETIIYYLIANTTNEAYKDELYSCIGRLHTKQNYKEVMV